MIRLFDLTPRMWLILAHDLLATAVAVLAAFYLRFGEKGLALRWELLKFVLPAFVIYSGWSSWSPGCPRPSGASPRCRT